MEFESIWYLSVAPWVIDWQNKCWKADDYMLLRDTRISGSEDGVEHWESNIQADLQNFNSMY